MAMTLMTEMVLPKMEANKKGAIISISSMAGLAPMPLITVYSATKVYVDFFSRGLQSEYEDKGIDIQVLHTGPVLTDMFKAASAPEDTKTSNFMIPSPERYAKQAH